MDRAELSSWPLGRPWGPTHCVVTVAAAAALPSPPARLARLTGPTPRTVAKGHHHEVRIQRERRVSIGTSMHCLAGTGPPPRLGMHKSDALMHLVLAMTRQTKAVEQAIGYRAVYLGLTTGL